MLNAIGIPLAHIFAGGLAASALLLMALVSVATGGQGSCISKERRLPIDSDAKVFGILFKSGGLIGLLIYCVAGMNAGYEAAIFSGIGGFLVGSIIGVKICSHLNDEYIARAYRNLEEGNYQEAIEDAQEVARSSEVLRSRANEIEAEARHLRQQTLGLGA